MSSVSPTATSVGWPIRRTSASAIGSRDEIMQAASAARSAFE